MREILFRGKRKDSGEWIEGWYCGKTCIDPFGEAVESSQIIESKYLFWHEVVPETVGQYTGLTAKNGVKIFEGDIMEYVNDDGTKAHYVVCVDGEMGSWVASLIGSVANVPLGYAIKIFEVIGNRFDNPELLEVNT